MALRRRDPAPARARQRLAPVRRDRAAGVLYATLEFGLPWWSGLIVFAGAVMAVAYAAILHFLASELFMRPVLEDISRQLPTAPQPARRWGCR